MTSGLVHSIQSLGAVDGPGLRTVVILQGCPLRCKFCHSIDTTLTDRGERMDANQLYDRVIKNRPYWKRYTSYKQQENHQNPDIQGGVTVTGGDPLAQPAFLLDFLKILKDNGVHTVVETSLFASNQVIDMLKDYVDLWMISLKYMEESKHLELTGRPNQSILHNILYLDEKLSSSKKDRSIRIRYVVVPGLTDDTGHALELGRFIKRLKSLESVELLPYVTMGRYKWVELYGEYELDGILEAEHDDLAPIIDVMKELDLPLFHQSIEKKSE